MRRADGVEVDEARALRRELVAVAGEERAYAVLERLLGAAGDQQHAQARQRPLAQLLGQREQRGGAGEVVVGAGNGAAAPHVGHDRGAEGADHHAGARRPAPPKRRPCDRAQRSGQADPPLGRGCLDPLEQLRSQLVEPPLQRLVEQQPRLGGVVVGEHHERVDPAGAALADARDQVDGAAAPAHEASQDARAVLGLVDDAGERPGREQRAERPPAAQDERRAGNAQQAEPGGGRRERPP